jgi:3-phosphoshikimate 1-carboxyvinyltransferase
MTLQCLKQFDITVQPAADFTEFAVSPQRYHPASYIVEGDWSSASYLLAAGAIGGVVVVDNLHTDSLQGDRQLVDFLRRMGASVTEGGRSVTVRKAPLKAIAADLTDCIDLLPTIAVLAGLCEGVTELSGIARARLKESDRVTSVVQELGRAGIRVSEERDRLLITGSAPRAALFNGHNDHRIAMAFSLMGLVTGDAMIEGAECVSKTYPEFWKVLADIGGEVSTDG